MTNHSPDVKRIIVTSGEPAGIGPDILIKIAQLPWQEELITLGDPDLLQTRAQKLGANLRLSAIDLAQQRSPHQPGTLKVIPIPLMTPTIPGETNPENAAYVMQQLKQAADICLSQKADALVTGPVQKAVLNQAGFKFTGHTEFFAHLCHVPQTVMLFVVEDCRIALVTTHLPLADVPKAITKEKFEKVLSILITSLKKQFHLAQPRVAVAGINPHAGEGGYLGREEIDTLIPVITAMQKSGHDVTGPLSADTIFIPQNIKKFDAILAMYHDQGLPIVKHLGFGHAVNMTLGLPFIRTSVDHGVALDLAGGPPEHIDAGSLAAAIRLAAML